MKNFFEVNFDGNSIAKNNESLFKIGKGKKNYLTQISRSNPFFEKVIVYYKEETDRFLNVINHTNTGAILCASTYDFNNRKCTSRYFIYLGLFVNEQDEEDKKLYFAGNDGIPFDSEEEAITYLQQNVASIYDPNMVIVVYDTDTHYKKIDKDFLDF